MGLIEPARLAVAERRGGGAPQRQRALDVPPQRRNSSATASRSDTMSSRSLEPPTAPKLLIVATNEADLRPDD